jgi:hypothetical protein
MKSSQPVPNSIVFLYNPDNANLDIPEWTGSAPYEANSGCVCVGTLAEIDGATTVELHYPFPTELQADMQLLFVGEIDTPNRQVSINTSQELDMMSVDVGADRSRVKVWANRMVEPDHIVFGLGG